jgi:hypothetical protein
MSLKFAHLLPLAPFVLVLACDSESRTLPSAPSITARRSAERPVVPSPRGTLQMVHDPVGNLLYLIGGISPVPCQDLACGNSLIDDLWSFTPRSRTWRQIADALPPREGDAAAMDFRSRQIVMYQPYFSDIPETWAYDVEKGTWENRRPADEPPGRWGSMMVYDSKADRALIYGGGDLNDPSGATGLGDLWAYDYETNTWTERHPPVSPSPHQWSALVYVPAIDRTILFGGIKPDGSLLNDTWAYDYRHDRWTNLQPENPPTPRMMHYMAFEPATNRLVMFGGFLAAYAQPTNDTWIYDVAANRWSQVFPKDSPTPRAMHVMSRTNGPVVLFGGGSDQPHLTNETFLYRSLANEWKQVAVGEQGDVTP